MTENCSLRDVVYRFYHGVLYLQDVIQFNGSRLNVKPISFVTEVAYQIYGHFLSVVKQPQYYLRPEQFSSSQICRSAPASGAPIYRLSYKTALKELHLIFSTEALCSLIP
jgi:hypothetical protein